MKQALHQGGSETLNVYVADIGGSTPVPDPVPDPAPGDGNSGDDQAGAGSPSDRGCAGQSPLSQLRPIHGDHDGAVHGGSRALEALARTGGLVPRSAEVPPSEVGSLFCASPARRKRSAHSSAHEQGMCPSAVSPRWTCRWKVVMTAPWR